MGIYVEELQGVYRAPTIKQHLAAIRRLFDWLVVGQVVSWNPAAAVRGPTHIVKRGKTPVLQPDEVRLLLDSIDTSSVGGLRDRALLGVMVYSFARVSAVVNMNVEDYYRQGKRWWLRLREKGGKEHALPVHHKGEQYLDDYLAAAGIGAERGTALWRSLTRTRELGERRMNKVDVFRMVKRRVTTAELGSAANCHTFRASGITGRSNAPRRSPGTRAPAPPSSTTGPQMTSPSRTSSGSGSDRDLDRRRGRGGDMTWFLEFFAARARRRPRPAGSSMPCSSVRQPRVVLRGQG